ncbi:hypothetical protein A7985_22040 [Pseudoalteromonas luteoviolacea]|uniref:Polysaccharide pyruvyl transferase domain-containing protein n=1 Tax=Pseudoalteromonas luteoviolacea TaxID=43657 RepID=A0A1C0TK90_9GAMM|nr:polysaccharide pyruvyl transferase family protein [Pseudoalteromonas luteoviolacea]OCQ18879.1 hypothetical protein A7985_22040 [Pseudoalteromonas luteoviolacea]
MQSKSDIFVVGYYGMRNSGDDALMLASVEGAKQAFSFNNVAVNASRQYGLVKQLELQGQGPMMFRGHQRVTNYKRAFDANKIVFGGGSVLHSSKDIAQKCHMISLCGRESSYAVGVGIEAFKTANDERQCAKFLNKCHFIGVRDAQSYEIAKSIAPSSNVALTFDLAPSLLHYFGDSIRNIDRRGVAFNFCQQATNAFGETDALNERARVRKAVKIITSVWETTREDVYLMELNDHGVLGDNLIHDQIISKLPSYVPIKRIRYTINPLRMLQSMAMFKAVVGMRLHAAIYAYMMNTPFVSLQYHSKCKQWSKQIGMAPDYQFDANEYEPESVIKTINKLVAGQCISPTLPVEQAIALSMKNWSNEYEQHQIFSRNPSLQ